MKKTKMLALAIALMMVLQLIMPINFTLAGSTTGSNVTGDIIWLNDSSIEITDSLGNEINPVNGVYEEIPKDAKIKIRYDFSLPDGDGYNFEAGDYFIVDFPDEISFQDIENKSFEVGGVKGTLSIENNRATIVFTELAASNIKGYFEVEGQFVEDKISEGETVSINLGYIGGIINIGFKETPPPDVNIDIDKTGVYDDLTNKITWTVIITPEEGKIAKSVSVVDTFSNNQNYVDNSTKVYKGASDVTSPSGITATGNKITYKFPGAIEGEHTITYQTTPKSTAFNAETGSGKVTFTNNAVVNLGTVEKGQANAKIELDWIQKKGTKDATNGKLIHWEITVNNDSKSIDNAVLTDIIPNGLELVSETVTVKNGEGSEEVVVSGTDKGQYSYIGQTFTYKYDGNLNVKSIVKYDTVVTDDRAYNQNSQIAYKNNASLTWENNVYGIPSAEGSVSVGIGSGIIDKYGVNKFNFNDNNNEIKWTIVVNKNKTKITNPVLVDNIPSGLEYIDNSFTISTENSLGEFIYGGNLTTTSSGIITYNFNKEINETYNITFKTKITDYSKLFINGVATFANSASLSGNELVNKKQTDSSNQQVDSQVLQKTVLNNYDYTTRKTKWQIIVNRNQMELANAILIDTIPEGMKFLPDTFVIDANIDAADGRGLSYDDSTFTYKFPETISDKYTITFETIVNEDYLSEQENLNKDLTLTNRAVLNSQGFSNSVSSNDSVTVKNYIIEKQGSYSTGADYIKWAVPINSNQVELRDIEISDTLQNGLELDIDSINFYNAEIDSLGNLIKSTKVDASKYTFTYENNVFTFKMDGETDKAYQLEFVTDVLSDRLTVKNTIEFKGAGKIASQTAADVVVRVSELGTGISGETGSVTITKVDEDNPNNILEGAQFRIYRLFNGIEKYSETLWTDENGQIVFDGLLYKTHYIEELSAPNGYLLNQNVPRFRITSDYRNIQYVFTNKKVIASIKLVKHTESGDALQGAEFTLYKDAEALQTKTSNAETGELVFEGIEVGTYTIKETKAPTGFYMSDIVINADVKIDDENNVDVTLKKDGEVVEDGYVIENRSIPNSPLFGKIVINKTDESSKSLTGAEFSLYNQYGKVIQTGKTDASGKIEFNHVEQGKYVIKETKAPDGYILSDKETDVTISGTATSTFDFMNKKEVIVPILGKVVIIKTDDEGKLLQGAKFNLYDSNNVVVQSLITGTSGKALFDNLPLGNYTIEETVAPKGYELSKELVNVTVAKSDLVEVTIKNKKTESTDIIEVNNLTGNILINKVDENELPLEGARFTLYDKNGVAIKNVVSDINGTVLFDNLQLGKYSVREILAPDGYELINDEMYIDVKDAKTYSYNFINLPIEEIDDPNVPRGWVPIDDPEIPKSPGTLPDTGSIFGTFTLIVIGSILILVGAIQLFRRRFIG